MYLTIYVYDAFMHVSHHTHTHVCICTHTPRTHIKSQEEVDYIKHPKP